MVHPSSTKSYASRAAVHPNPMAKRLLELMDRKKTNLCVSVDVTTTAEVLEIVKAAGESICMVKTHCDILEDFTMEFTKELQRLSEELDFMIFEDRKFADIGSTVSLQYSSGLHKIASWSHITNAHGVPGPGIIEGLGVVGKPLGRGLLLLAEMSSAGNLATGSYTDTVVEMARKDPEFVFGFIAMKRLGKDDEDFLTLTPGVDLEQKGDAMGQQYRTPSKVIKDSECDVIIVGRGVYKVKGEENIKASAERYRQQGWQAYEQRTSQ